MLRSGRDSSSPSIITCGYFSENLFITPTIVAPPGIQPIVSGFIIIWLMMSPGMFPARANRVACVITFLLRCMLGCSSHLKNFAIRPSCVCDANVPNSSGSFTW